MSKFIPSPALIPMLLADEAMLADDLEEKGQEVLHRAQSIAPVDTGAFLASLSAEVLVEDGIIRARIGTDDDESKVMALEYGTSDTPTFATLRRALDG